MRTPSFRALAAALALLTAATAPLAGAAPEPAQVVLRTLERSKIQGRLIALDAKGVTVREDGGTDRRHELASAIGFTLPAKEVRHARGERFRIWLTGGSTLVGTIAGGAEDVVTFESVSLGRLEILLDDIRTIEALPAPGRPELDLAAKHERNKDGDDIAYDAGEDEYAGSALEVSTDGVLIETAGKRERSVAWKNLRVLHLENPVLKAPTGLRSEVELQDGSRVATATPPVLEGTSFVFALRAMPKAARRAARDAVRAVRWRGARFDYASELPFRSTYGDGYKQPAMLADLVRPGEKKDNEWMMGVRVDRRLNNEAGTPLIVGGVTFRHGFGVNSRNELTIPLAAGYATFRTYVGIDDSVLATTAWKTLEKDRAAADVRILGDGKVLWEAKGIRGGQKARFTGDLDVRGVKELVLVADLGTDLVTGMRRPTFDYVDWGEPILIKPAP